MIYYVNEEVILKSRSIKDKKDKDRREMLNKISKVTKDVSDGVYTRVVEAPKTVVKKIGKPLTKKKSNSGKRKITIK